MFDTLARPLVLFSDGLITASEFAQIAATRGINYARAYAFLQFTFPELDWRWPHEQTIDSINLQ